MKAHEVISILEGYDSEMEVSVSFSTREQDKNTISIASCGQKQPRCYQNLVELSPEGMLVLNHHDKISYANPYLMQLLGYKEEDLFFMPLSMLIKMEDTNILTDKLSQLKATHRVCFSLPMVMSSGDTFWAQLSMTAIPSEDASYRGAFLTVTDITYRKTLLKQASDDNLDKKIERIPAHIENLKELKTTLIAEKMTYEGTLLINASPYWHKDKYLYLIHPKKNGKRVREYIGTKESKVKNALYAVKRAKRYNKLCEELEEISQQLRTATFKLDSFLWELAKVPPELHTH